MEYVLLLIRLVLFAVFGLAAIGKFLDLKGAEQAVEDFGTPKEFAKVFAIALPFAEIVFAFCFLFTSTAWIGALGGAILLLSFTGAMTFQLAKGNSPDCHCFGQIHTEPVSVSTLVRNLVFLVLAAVLLVQGRDRQGASLTTGNSTADNIQVITLFAGLLLTAAVLFYVKRVLDNQKRILQRLELLELVSRDGVPVSRSDVGHPLDGLPIGAHFPKFELPDVSGRSTSLRDVLSEGRPAIVFFVSSTCDPCKALLPEMEKWEAEMGDRINFVLMSSGDSEMNDGKFGVFSADVILQEKREIAELVQARWTPTALFVRSDGTIGSHVAAGDTGIRELVEEVRKADLSDRGFFIPGAATGGQPQKIGKSIPDFTLEDTTGRKFTEADLKGKRTLAVFWSLTCPHCEAMMEELKIWDISRTESDPELVVFSDGSRDAHEALGLRSPIIIDAGYKTSAELGMFGTPSAVLIDESGTIVTGTATGASNIWSLLGNRK